MLMGDDTDDQASLCSCGILGCSLTTHVIEILLPLWKGCRLFGISSMTWDQCVPCASCITAILASCATGRVRLIKAPAAEAKAAGYKALAITVDSPRLGHREADERNKYAPPCSAASSSTHRVSWTGGHSAGCTEQKETPESSRHCS